MSVVSYTLGFVVPVLTGLQGAVTVQEQVGGDGSEWFRLFERTIVSSRTAVDLLLVPLFAPAANCTLPWLLAVDRSLYLCNNNLTGSLPDALSALTLLTQLDMSTVCVAVQVVTVVLATGAAGLDDSYSHGDFAPLNRTSCTVPLLLACHF